jgi:hypothetical protein
MPPALDVGEDDGRHETAHAMRGGLERPRCLTEWCLLADGGRAGCARGHPDGDRDEGGGQPSGHRASDDSHLLTGFLALTGVVHAGTVRARSIPTTLQTTGFNVPRPGRLRFRMR